MEFRDSAAGTFICKALGDIYNLSVAATEFCDSPEKSKCFVKENTWSARFEAADVTFSL
jgi:hypothetical protein